MNKIDTVTDTLGITHRLLRKKGPSAPLTISRQCGEIVFLGNESSTTYKSTEILYHFAERPALRNRHNIFYVKFSKDFDMKVESCGHTENVLNNLKGSYREKAAFVTIGDTALVSFIPNVEHFQMGFSKIKAEPLYVLLFENQILTMTKYQYEDLRKEINHLYDYLKNHMRNVG